jgi:membrane protein DedA with SNARE-associated domain
MDHISIGAIKSFIEIHAIIIYLILFLGVIIEGEIVVIFAGIFSYLGSINIFLAFIFIILGGVFKSFFGYSIGHYLNKHHSHKTFVRKVEGRISYFLPRFKEKPFWSIFASRFFILGIGWFTILFSGYKNIPLKIYIKAEAYSLLLWSVGIMTLGYFFSYTALAISRDVRHILVMILMFFITFFILEKIIAFIFEIFNINHLNEELE